MFDLVDENILWSLQPDAIKIKDSATTQMLYNGELRGQTQRYMIVVGRLIKDFFDKVEDLYSWGNIKTHSSLFLDNLLLLYYLNFFGTSITDAAKKEILDEAVWFWKLKGTVLALRWITWKVFNWEVDKITTLTDLIMFTCDVDSFLPGSSSVLYDNSKTLDDSRVLYSGRLINWSDWGITVDVNHDADFAAKKIIYERLCDLWGYADVSHITYLNS
jgi:hypothetical protein